MARRSQVPFIGIAVPMEDGRRNSMKHVGDGVLNLGLVSNQKQRRLQFDDIIPTGVVAQTANGTARDVGTGQNCDQPWSSPQIEPRPAWPSGRSNRTGE